MRQQPKRSAKQDIAGTTTPRTMKKQGPPTPSNLRYSALSGGHQTLQSSKPLNKSHFNKSSEIDKDQQKDIQIDQRETVDQKNEEDKHNLNFARLSQEYSQSNNYADQESENEEYDDFYDETINMMNHKKRQSINMELNMSNLSNEKKLKRKDELLNKSSSFNTENLTSNNNSFRKSE